jgi:hypothetical protein
VRAEVTEDVLHHDDGRVDDDAEVDRAERDQVGRRIRRHEAAERDEERERDVDRGDERGAHVPEEDEEHRRDEAHPDEEVLDDRVGRQLHQRAAVVIRLDVHPRRQDVVLPDVVDLRVDALQRRLGLAAVAHEDDALDDVGIVVEPDEAEPRREADVDVGHVADADGRSLELGHDDVLDVALGRRPRAEETDAADVVALLAHEEAVAADVLVRVLDRGGELPQRDAVPAEAIRVDFDVVLLRLAAVAGDVDDALDRLELALEDPVLGRLQILEGVALSDHAIPEHLADRVPRRERRLHARRQRHELDAVDDLLLRGEVRGVPVEVTFHVGKREEALRANVLEAGHARKADLERHRDVPLGLLGAPSRRLRDDLDQRGHRVRVRLDVELLVGEQADDDEQRSRREHHERHPEGRGDDLLNHGTCRRFRASATGGLRR